MDIPSTDRPAYALPLLLLGGFRHVIDSLHTELAAHGHPDMRPVHGFALQAVADGCSIGELGRRLGVSKQAAAKTATGLERLGYVRRETDPRDGRAQRLLRTASGEHVLALSAEILQRIHAGWSDQLGAARLHDMEEALASMLAGSGVVGRVDLPGWLHER